MAFNMGCDKHFARECGKLTTIGLEDIFKVRDSKERLQRRTKIICTLGPSSANVDILVKLIDAGMDVCRFNFSHGDHESHRQYVENVKEAMKQRPQKKLGLMLDTKGPEIRTSMLAEEYKDGIHLTKGQELKIYCTPEHLGTPEAIGCTYELLAKSVKPKNIILLADGSVSVEVVSCAEDHVVTKVLNNAKIGSRKNMNLPGVKVDLPVCGDREIFDLSFVSQNGMHYVAASFVQCAEDVRTFRKHLGPTGKNVKIIPKIENQEGLINFDEILAESDGIMIARGDLGMEIPLEKVFLAQKMMIAKCNIAGKPVIVATQMLESMIVAPRPTRAEVSDCANAVLDGCDCVMLSGESANGLFPLNAVEVLARTCLEAESCIDYRRLYQAIHNSIDLPLSVPEAVCCSAVEIAQDTRCPLVIALTETGYTARMIAKYRPRQIVLAVSASEANMSCLANARGVIPMKVESFQGTENVIKNALITAQERHLIKKGEYCVIVHGQQEEVSGYTNTLVVRRCD